MFRDKIITRKNFPEYNDVDKNQKKFKITGKISQSIFRYKEAIDKENIIQQIILQIVLNFDRQSSYPAFKNKHMLVNGTANISVNIEGIKTSEEFKGKLRILIINNSNDI
jgi:hypothetical protein